jgi:hypothetical protein
MRLWDVLIAATAIQCLRLRRRPRVRQRVSQKNLARILGARHLAEQREPLLIARAVDEATDRLHGKFARGHAVFGRQCGDAGHEREIIESEQRLADHGLIFEASDDVSKQHDVVPLNRPGWLRRWRD